MRQKACMCGGGGVVERGGGERQTERHRQTEIERD